MTPVIDERDLPKDNRLAYRLRAWGPAAVWAAVLFLLGAWPIRLDDDWWPPVSDKVAHLGLYTVLGAALAYARFRGARGPPHVMMVVIGAFYGASNEWYQRFVPGRTPSLGDWAADVAGVVLGYGLVMLLANGFGRRDEAEAKEKTT